MVCAIIIMNIIPATDAVAINPFTKTDTIITASQSGSGEDLPSNVMAAFNSASAYNIMCFSISVVMTSDDVLIVADEDDLSKYTDFSGNISSRTYEDIAELNFAYKYTQDGKIYPYRDQSFVCVKLEELFEAFPYSNFIVNIVQTGDKGQRAAVMLCELIRQNKFSLRVVVKGCDEAIDYAREQTNVHVLTEDKESEFDKFIALNKILLSKLCGRLNFQYVEISIDELDNYRKVDLKALQSRNVSIFITEVDTKEELETAERYEVDGIITNDPGTIMEVLGSSANTE